MVVCRRYSSSMHTTVIQSRPVCKAETLSSKKARGMHSTLQKAREQWTALFLYEKRYLISNYGRIKKINGTVVIPSILRDGYMGVNLTKANARRKKWRLHRLVALSFIPNPTFKKYVNHKDGDKLNNLVSNLEWCTAKENDMHARRLGLKKWAGYNAQNPKLTRRQVLYIRKSSLSQRVLAKKFDVSHPTIGDIKRGTTWKKV